MRIVLFLLAISAASAQVNRTIAVRGNEIMITFQRTGGSMRLIAGAPYSADVLDQHTQTLADGTVITDPPGSQHSARDSQGRTRIMMPILIPKSGDGWQPSLTQIGDPVAGFLYLLDDPNKVAHRVKLNEHPKRDDRRRFTPENRDSTSDADHHQIRTENLGEKMIEGVQAKGMRTTVTWPAGTQNNDRPIVTTQETWFSDDLQENLFQKLTNPRNGEVVQRLANIDRAEPDPMLFQPPADYKIVDEETTFTITLHRPH